MVGIRHDGVDIERVKVGISGIVGVFDVEFNYLTRKFTVIYDGAEETLVQINNKLIGATRLTR